jgi:hypothetical protein
LDKLPKKGQPYSLDSKKMAFKLLPALPPIKENDLIGTQAKTTVNTNSKIFRRILQWWKPTMVLWICPLSVAKKEEAIEILKQSTINKVEKL